MQSTGARQSVQAPSTSLPPSRPPTAASSQTAPPSRSPPSNHARCSSPRTVDWYVPDWRRSPVGPRAFRPIWSYGSKVTTARPRFRILAENEWFNAPAFFQSLTAFVQPNAPEVHRVLSEASRLLQERTGDSSLQGYQAGSKRA